MSYIREMGPLAIASRLKNLSEKLMREMVQLYKKHHVDFNPRWFTFIHLISRRGPMGITSIARLLSQTHPAANQVANALEVRGYILSRTDRTDSRKRIIALTPKGERLIRELNPLWEAVENAVSRLLEQSSPSFLKELDILETQLEIRSMKNRIERELATTYSKKLKLVPFNPSLKTYFKSLNIAWLKEYFEVEKEDERLLNNPETAIIQAGGRIVFGIIDGEVTGTGALLHRDDGTAEITKMAVDPIYRGYGFSRRILRYLIKEAEIGGYKKIVLLTSEKLIAALALYRSEGFIQVPVQQDLLTKLSRNSIQMEKKLL